MYREKYKTLVVPYLVCDMCDKEVEALDGRKSEAPTGWNVICTPGNEHTSPAVRHVCPDCTEAKLIPTIDN